LPRRGCARARPGSVGQVWWSPTSRWMGTGRSGAKGNGAKLSPIAAF